jgi:hypothetical protein
MISLSLLVTDPVKITKPHRCIGKSPGISEDIRNGSPVVLIYPVYQYYQGGQSGGHCPDMTGLVPVIPAVTVEDFSFC